MTRLALEATGMDNGVDVKGHRDYRGVKVVAVWRWLPAYNFGVGTQMDAAEAFALGVIRWAMSSFTLLAVSAGVMFFFMLVTRGRDNSFSRRLPPPPSWASTRSRRSWAKGAWARSIGPATRCSADPLPSR